MKRELFILLCLVGLISCGQVQNKEVINMEKTEKLIPLLEKFDFSKIELTGNSLVINDTLIRFENDTTKINIFVADSLSLVDWSARNSINQDTVKLLLTRIRESRNKRIIKENNTYFFSEGGWIDSDFGKAYSTTNITDKMDKFKFDRIREIRRLENKKNWYDYYAD